MTLRDQGDPMNSQTAVWYEEGISKLVSRYDKCPSIQGDYVEKQAKVCDKTCILFFFPIINKYLCMAKRSLLSRCPQQQWREKSTPLPGIESQLSRAHSGTLSNQDRNGPNSRTFDMKKHVLYKTVQPIVIWKSQAVQMYEYIQGEQDSPVERNYCLKSND